MGELDGLRAVAITMVLAFHFLRVPVPHHHWLDYPTRLLAIGFGGVDLFFVLSGFLVGGILIDTRSRPAALRSFLVRRLIRIVPLYAVTVIAFYLERAAFGGGWLFDGAVPWWAYATLTQDFATPLLQADAWFLGPTWSLAVEVQIYILLGLLVIYAPIRALAPLMVAGVLTAWGLRALASSIDQGLFGYFAMPARIDGACVGVLVAVVLRSSRAAAVRENTPALIAAAALLFGAAAVLAALGQGIGTPVANCFIHSALAVGSGALIAALASSPPRLLSMFLRWSPAVWLGTISYGVYLLHKPVVGTLFAALGQSSVLPDTVPAALVLVVGVILTLAIAAASWRWFEGPMIRWGHRITRVEVAATREVGR